MLNVYQYHTKPHSLYGFEQHELPKIKTKVKMALGGEPSVFYYIKKFNFSNIPEIVKIVKEQLTNDAFERLGLEKTIALIKSCGIAVDDLSFGDKLYEKAHLGELEDILNPRYFKDVDKLVKHLMDYHATSSFRYALERNPELVEYLRQHRPVADEIEMAAILSQYKIRIKNEGLLLTNVTSSYCGRYLTNNNLYIDDIPGFSYKLESSVLKNILFTPHIPIKDTNKAIEYLQHGEKDTEINNKMVIAFKSIRGIG